MIITRRINIATQTNVTSSGIATNRFWVDLSAYSGTVTAYLELGYTLSSASNTDLVFYRYIDYQTFTPTTYSGVFAPGTLQTVRVNVTNALFSPSTTAYYGIATPGITSVFTATLVIIQDTGSNALTATEGQFEIGSLETGFASVSLAPSSKPKYWKYDSSKYDGTCAYSWEAIVFSGGTMITMTLALQTSSDLSTWTTVGTQQTSASAGAVRAGRFSFTPVNGNYYRIACMSGSTKTSVNLYNAKIVVTQIDTAVMSDITGTINTFREIYGDGGLNEQEAQAFVPASNYYLYSIEPLISAGSTGVDSLTLELRSDSVTGTLLASKTLPYSSLSVGYAYNKFQFDTPVLLSTLTTYFIVLKRTGSRSTTNYYSWRGSDAGNSTTGSGWTRNSGVWTENTALDLFCKLNGSATNTYITKGEEQYLVANTTLAAGTAAQNFLVKYDPSDWSGVDNTYIHQTDSNATSMTAEIDTAAGVQVTGSQVTGTALVKQSSAMTMPGSATNLDVKATTNSGAIYASRIIVSWSKSTAPPATYTPYSFCIIV